MCTRTAAADFFIFFHELKEAAYSSIKPPKTHFFVVLRGFQGDGG